MGVVSEGRLFTGAHGLAGEIGFLPWPGQQKPERLEDAVSGVAVVEAARRFGMSGQLTAKAVFDAARQGNDAAVKAVRLEGERIAHTVAAAAAVLDPDLVVLGGGVAHSVDLLLHPVREHLRALTPCGPGSYPAGSARTRCCWARWPRHSGPHGTSCSSAGRRRPDQLAHEPG